MADVAEPADQAPGEHSDSGSPAVEMSLTDLIDQIEREAFQRALDSRHGDDRDA